MPQRKWRLSIRVTEQTALFEHSASRLPPFASTPEEIKRAVERNAVQRGILLVKVLVALNMDAVIATVGELATQYDKEEMYETAAQLGIDPAALALLDQARPPMPYPYYFCTPASAPTCTRKARL